MDKNIKHSICNNHLDMTAHFIGLSFYSSLGYPTKNSDLAREQVNLT